MENWVFYVFIIICFIIPITWGIIKQAKENLKEIKEDEIIRQNEVEKAKEELAKRHKKEK